MKKHPTREAWLLAAAELLRPIFAEKGFKIPECSVSCGFPSTGMRSSAIGQCWSTRSSTNSLNQIFISPILEDPYEVIDTLVHELVHAVDDCLHKHGKEFKKIALSVGLEGKMRHASAGEKLKLTLIKLLKILGPYPHGKLKIITPVRIITPRPKAICKKCGFQVPMYKKFLSYGPPICPKDKISMKQVGVWEET